MESRYARQEALPFIGKEGQENIRKSSVAIVGCGALGSVAAELLCRSGVGELMLIDHDIVERTNLQRQSLYTEQDVDKPKVEALAKHLREINSDVTITAKPLHLAASSIMLLDNVDCIIDGTDDVDTRLIINEYAKKTDTPWIYGGAIAERGFVYAVTKDAPCFACVFPRIEQGESCEEYGILNSTSHIVGSLQSLECIKILIGKQATKGLIRINALGPMIETLTVKKNPACKVCKGEFSLLNRRATDSPKKRSGAMRGATRQAETGATKKKLTLNLTHDFTIQKCKTRAGWSARPIRSTKLDLAKIKKKFTIVLDTPILIVIRKDGVVGDIIIHNYGEILFKELADEKIIRAIAAEIYEAAT
ncbi:HesA/MoeB/ThiF family protein [Candidatus Woesearchaeota archaeon]|nr:HesA/MoeB/ThiF family protein [Candidatus Woesearchaeota archaeon]